MRRPEIIGPGESDKWDRFVESHPFGQVYHLTAWKNVLERCFEHIKGFRYVIRDEEDRIMAGLPVFRVKSWLTGTRLVCAPFASLYDPLVSNREQMDALSRALMGASRQLGCSRVELRTYRGDQYLEGSVFAASRFYKLHYLSLNEPPEALKRRFHRTCVRQRISRAEKSGLRIKIADGKTDLRTFYGLLSMTRTRRGLPLQPFAYVEALWDELRPLGMLTVLIAQKDSRAIAAVLLLTYRDRVSVEVAASDKSFLCFSPIHYLFWEAIKWASARGFGTIDFGRTSPNNSNLMEFKERWGTECADLPYFYYPGHAAVMDSRREDSWKYTILRKLIASPMPSSFRRYIGALCYRHLG
jgi:hypothetical protein